MSDLLEIKGISKTFPGVKALDNINMTIKHGEVHALVGENGAGKSTLIKILSGVYHPDPGGSIYVENKLIKLNNINESIDHGISVIYQDLCLFQNLSVAENINYGKGDKRIISWKEYGDKAAETLSRLDIIIDPKEKLGSLSIAKQQLVAIARAIAYNCKLLVMDEPTSSLSKSEAQNLFGIIRSLREKGLSILFISHKLDEVKAISNTVTILRDGMLIGTSRIQDVGEQEIIQMMVGRKISYEKLNESSSAKSTVALEVKNLTKAGYYKDISFFVREGEILGITGLVGSGRTEVIKTIFGILKADSGDILVNGVKTRINNTTKAKRLGISFVPEDRQHEGIIMEFDVFGNVALVNHESAVNIIGIIDNRKIRDITAKIVDQLDVRPKLPNRRVKEFSGGNQQKIVIGKWLATNPTVLLVDEPTYGVDIGSKIEIHKLLRNLAAEGMAIIVVSSEFQEIVTMTDRILVMRRGSIAAEMEANQTSQEMILQHALENMDKVV